jgi:ribosomal subunit interface protein
MRIIVSSRHTRVPAALEAAVHNKLERIAHRDRRITLARVHFSAESRSRTAQRECCEVILECDRGERLVGRACGPDGYACVDQAIAKLVHQLDRRRGRRLNRVRTGYARVG